MTDLSFAAQAVRDAAFHSVAHDKAHTLEARVAAALRAAADQVAPDDYASFTGHIEWDQGMETRNDSIRAALLAIAAELEGSHD